MRRLPFAGIVLALFLATPITYGQAIEFESNGLRYQTLTRGGVTIMFAQLPAPVREYSVLQVAISNGSKVPWVVKPEDFSFHEDGKAPVIPTPPRRVIDELLDKASRTDVIKLVSTYEAGLYGMSRIQSTSGYEQRRQAALAEVGSAKLKAAAAASALALISTRLTPGESTDGAIFLSHGGKALGSGKLRVRAAGEVFEFDTEFAGALIPRDE